MAATLTTVFVFAPIVLIEDEVGQLYSDIAIAISSSILMSMVLAIALVPAAAGRILHVQGDKPRRQPLLTRAGAAFGRGVIAGVHWLTQGNLRPLATIVVVLCGAWAIIHYLTPDAEYLPEGEESKVRGPNEAIVP